MGAIAQSILHGDPPVILAASLAASIWILHAGTREKVTRALLVCATAEAFLGALLAALMGTHVLAVIVRRVQLKEEMWVRFEPHIRIAGIPYDFRIYSLVLLGVLGAWAGVSCVRASRAAVTRNGQNCRGVCRPFVAMCLLTIPILPMQPFAVPVLGISIIGILIALFGSRLSPKEELCVS